jgi:hypothetical protein
VRTCCKLADSVRHREDGSHGADVCQVEAQGGVSHHDWSAVRQTATRQVERGVAATQET